MARYFLALGIVAILLIAGCAAAPAKDKPPAANGSKNNGGGSVGVPNPASQFCEAKGYMLDLQSGAAGFNSFTVGICKFPNGRECEEWAFFRGECTDADSFEMVEGPDLALNPKSISYKFHSDGRLVLTTTYLREGNSSSLYAWLQPSDFAAFVKKLAENGFESFNISYSSCNERPCPMDSPTITLVLYRQGKEKRVSVYYPSDRPKSVDRAIADSKRLFETSTFVEVSASGCSLVQDRKTKQFDCFGCTSGITNPVCKDDPPAESVAVEQGDEFGRCVVDAQGACAYQPPKYLSEELCNSAGGYWNECGSACRGFDSDAPCVAVCVQYCECGGVIGARCPTGYFCTDPIPKVGADAGGICKRLQ